MAVGHLDQHRRHAEAQAGPHDDSDDDSHHAAGDGNGFGPVDGGLHNLFKLIRGDPVSGGKQGADDGGDNGGDTRFRHRHLKHAHGYDQVDQRKDQVHIFYQFLPGGQLALRHALDVVLSGVQVHGHKDRHVEQHRGNQRRLHQVEVGDSQILCDQEGRRAHDRRHDLAARGRRGFHRCGVLVLKTAFLHHGNGEGAGPDHVGDGAAADGAEKAAGHHRDLGRAAPELSEGPGSQLGEVIANPRLIKHRAQNDKQHDVAGRGINRSAVNPVRAQVHHAGDPGDIHPHMGQESRHVLSHEAIDDKADHHDGQGFSHRPAGGLDQSDDQQHAE